MRIQPRTLAIVLLLVLAPVAAADDGVVLLATADGQGALTTCKDCPMRLGGMAKRATLVAGIRGQTKGTLLVDAGNSLIGPESESSKGAIVARLFEKLGYDAVNVSWRDFRLGRKTTVDLLTGRSFAAISANLADEKTGALLFPASTVVTAGGERIRIIGATHPAPPRSQFPWLADQLEGVKILPPKEAVEKALNAGAEADRLVLLYYGSAAALRLDLGDLVSRFDLVVLGGCRPDELPPKSRVPLAAALPRGKSLARATLDGPPRVEEPVLVRSKVEDDPEVAKLVAAALKPEQTSPPPLPEGELGEMPADLSRLSGKHVHLRAESEDRAFGLTVLDAEIGYTFGRIRPGAGRRLLVLDVSVENRIAPDLVLDGGLPDVVQVADLRRQMFLLLNGATVVPLAPGAWEEPEHLARSFRLAPGDAEDGKLVFAVPAKAIRTLELRFYPDGFAPVSVVLKKGENPPEKPMAGPVSNRDLTLSVASFELSDRFLGKAPMAGRKFAIVEIRGQSRLSMQTPALALREGAAPGETARCGQVFEWKKGGLLLCLTGDDRYAYPPDDLTGGKGWTPMFLPDRTAGFTLVYQVPEGMSSWRLDCDFPQMRLSTEREMHTPAPLLLPLAGEKPAGPLHALKAVDDPPLRVGVISVDSPETFAGRKPGKDARYVVFTLAIRNESTEGGALDPGDRFRLATGDRDPAKPHYLSGRGPHPGPGLAYLPPGRNRAFELVWEVPRDVDEVVLVYTGVGLAVRLPFELSHPGDPTTALATAGPAAGAGPESGPGSAPVPPEPPKPKGLEGFGIRGADVNRAIRRGREYLWKTIQKEDLGGGQAFGGQRRHVLAALALVHAEALAEFPDLVKPLRGLLESAGLRSTYGMGLYLMLVRSYGDPSFYPRAAEVAQTLVDRQAPNGSWTYGDPIPPVKHEEEKPRKEEKPPERQDGPFAITGGEPPAAKPAPKKEERAFTPRTLRRTAAWGEGDSGDNSCTQFALLGLRSAAEFGVTAPAKTWRRALDGFLARQSEGGGWGYTTGGQYGSMTCAGICSVALARDALGAGEPADDPAIRAGLGWLSGHYRADRNPGNPGWDFYYIYSVERVGQLLDTEFIGPYEWYPLGVRALLRMQQADGSWVGSGKEGDPVIATSFALLFLTRATEKLRPDASAKEEKPAPPPPPEEPGRLVTAVHREAGRTWYFILDASGSMRTKLDGQEKFRLARAALEDLVATLPDSSRVALRVYGHRYFAIDEKADEDSELVIPPGPLDRKAFDDALSRLGPKGKTPIAYSLAQAAKDLKAAGGPATVILLTDGGEDTIPRGDPVAAARRLAAGGKIRLRVVGFDIGRPQWTAQLKETAAAAGGTYISARDHGELVRVLARSSGVVPDSFRVLDEDGSPVATGEFGDTVALPVGTYRFETEVVGRAVQTTFHVSSGETVRIQWNPNPEEGRTEKR